MQDSTNLSGETAGLQPKTECFAHRHGAAFPWLSQEGRELASQRVIGNPNLSKLRLVRRLPAQLVLSITFQDIGMDILGQKAVAGSDQ